MRLGLLFAVLLSSLVACGQVEPVIVAVSMPECTSSNVRSMREGRLSLSLTLNGIAHSGVAVAELIEDHSYDELQEHVATGSDVWERRPEWLRVRAELELSSAQGLDGVEETVYVESGDYAIVCLDHDTPSGTRMRVESPLRVRAG
ncbi:MAG: hypothetical protein WAL25_00830 [Acidimicrobiia bacterium]